MLRRIVSFLNRLKADIVVTETVSDITVDVQDGEIRVPELPEIGTAESIDYGRMPPEQVGRSVQESIQSNVQAQPRVVQNALVEGMSALVKIETRLRTESRNVNYNGLNVDTSQTAYMDFQMARGTIKAAKLQVAAEAMAGDIRAAFETWQLTETEAGKLKDVLTGIVGDVGLAQTYVEADTDTMSSERFRRLNPQYSVTQERKTLIDTPFDTSGRLRPDAKYKSGEFGYNYETDNLRRITSFNAEDLRITSRGERLRHNPNTPGKLSGDHAGHLAGDLFGGSSELDNLVSQSPNVNLREYRKIENIWAKAIREGKKVSVNVDIKYEGNSLRPFKFIVRYEIDGKRFIRTIFN